MDRSAQIIQTSWIGIIANVLLASFKAVVGLLANSVAIVMDAVKTVGVYAIATGDNKRAELQTTILQTLVSNKDIVQVHGFYYSEKENMISVDVVPDISIHDDKAFVSHLIDEIQPLVPGIHLEIVIDHNYSE